MFNEFEEYIEDELIEDEANDDVKRTLAYRRYQRHRAISKRKKLSKNIYQHDWYDVDGKYDKGKIYCNCGVCNYGRKYKLPTTRTKREKQKYKAELKEYYDVA